MKKNVSIVTIFFLIPLSIFSQAPDYLWVKNNGGGYFDNAELMVVDSFNNIYVGGEFSSHTLPYSSTTLINSYTSQPDDYTYDIFLTKYDQNGNILWAKSAGGINDDGISSLIVDSIGNIYITGTYGGSYTGGTLNFTIDSLVFSNADNIGNLCVAKFNTNGNLIWAKSFENIGGIVTTDNKGHLYLTGSFSATFNLDSITLTNNSTINYTDIYLAQLDTNGNVLWAKSYGDIGSEGPSIISIDKSDNILITGHFNSPSLMFDSITLTNNTNNDNIFLTKFNSSGDVLWANSIVNSNINDVFSGLTFDQVGNIFISGSFKSQTITFGSNTLYNNSINNNDIFIVNYNSNGTPIWATSYGDVNDDFPSGVTLDNTGCIYVTGAFYSPKIVFGQDTLFNFNPGYSDIFISKLSPLGIAIWTKKIGGFYNDYGNDIAIDNTGSVYTIGGFAEICEFDSIILANVANNLHTYDIFLTKIGSTVGLKEVVDDNIFTLFPNPTQERIFIRKKSIFNDILTLKIFNTSGSLVFHKVLSENSFSFGVDLSSLTQGVYFLHLTSNRGNYVVKLIKN
ncbi:MAG: T9SS type A sorting domain-containing protein [Bacteroidetes bacterium]|nr:T9SS type A sorting domain-containing protein [Bacteroidota bacterium]